MTRLKLVRKKVATVFSGFSPLSGGYTGGGRRLPPPPIAFQGEQAAFLPPPHICKKTKKGYFWGAEVAPTENFGKLRYLAPVQSKTPAPVLEGVRF